MHRPSASILVAVAWLMAGLAAAQVSGPIQLWSNPNWSNWNVVPSQVMSTPATDNEAADDFNVTGVVMRVLANGSGCLTCGTVNGVWVRFYQWNNGAVGALQQQQFVPASDPGLILGHGSTDALDVTLPLPFAASGRHFVSVQVSFAPGGTWGLWTADLGAPLLSAAKYRTSGGAWGPYQQPFGGPLNSDIDLQLWGIPNTPPSPTPPGPCGTWSILSTPAPAGTSHCLTRDLRVIGSGDAWLVGEADRSPSGFSETFTFAEHWDGSHWAIIPTPSPSPAPGLTNCSLFAVDGTSGSDAWAGGWQNKIVNGGWQGQQLLTMYWNGSSWAEVPSPLPTTNGGASVNGAAVADISALAPNDVWFAGSWIDLNLATSQTSRPGLLMRWNGSSFQRFTAPIVVGVGQAFSAIKALATDDAWAVGSASTGNSTVAVAFHWNGTSWTHRPPPNPYGGPFVTLSDVDARSGSDVWVAAYSYTATPGQGQAYLAHWNGTAWSTVAGPPAPVQGIHLDPGGDIYAVGGGVWRYNGTAWASIETFPTVSYVGLNTIDSSGPCELWVGGGQLLANQAMPFAARTNAPGLWNSRTRLSCAPLAAPALLRALTPPRVGSVFTVAASDPQNFLGAGGGIAQAIWVIAGSPASSGSCGLAIATGGVSGGPGELLIDVGTMVLALGPIGVSSGSPAAIWSIPLPPDPALLGIDISTQAALINPAAPALMTFTNALDVRLGL